MPSIIVPGRQAVRINWANPIARDLYALHVPHGRSAFDVVSGRMLSAPSSGIVQARGPVGVGWNFANATDQFTGVSPQPKFQDNFSCVYIATVGSSGFRAVGKTHGASEARDWLVWGMNPTNFSFTLMFVVDVSSGIAGTVGHTYCVVCSYYRLVEVRFFIRNLTTGAVSRAITAVASTPGTATGSPTFGADEGANGWGSHVFIEGRFGRALSDSEALSLMFNPRQLVTSPRPFYYPASVQYSRPILDISNSGWTGHP